MQNAVNVVEPQKLHQRKWVKQVTRFEYVSALRWTLIVVSLPLFWLFLGYQPNVQLAITSLLVVMFYDANSINKGHQRLLGAVVGFLLAIPALAIIGGNAFTYVILIFAISFILEVTFFTAKYNYIALQGVICFVVGIGSDSHLDASVSRIVGIFFGFVFTYIIVRWLWPKNLQREQEAYQAQSQQSLLNYLQVVKSNLLKCYLFNHHEALSSYWHWQIEHDLNQLKRVKSDKVAEYTNIYNQLSHDAFIHTSPIRNKQASRDDLWQQLNQLYEVQRKLI